MDDLEQIAERIRTEFESRNTARDEALAVCRILTRHASHAIRAIHRSDTEEARSQLHEADQLAEKLRTSLASYPDLFFSGYTQDALKEYSEAHITCALIQNHPLPKPEELRVENATYMNGLAEAVGELRRRCLDILRQGYNEEAERLLSCMDDIYSVLITMDYPDAITFGLRRHTDLARGIVERTRGDLTISLREQHLENALADLSRKLDES